MTIPFEVEKLTEGGRTLGGNVLEAAILSLRTHPNPAVQAKVDAAVRAIAAKPGSGNRGFEAAVTYFQTTGKRDLLDLAIKNAEALYDEFKRTNPPFNGGERDALNCSQLYRVTQDKKHLDLAKHYLDIRGLENSVGRSRHNQSYKPVVDQSEVVGHAVNCVTLVLSMHDVGVLTGLKEYTQAAQRMWTDAVTKKMYITGGVGSTGHEGFGEPYVLPNISAYAETCAVLMFMTLNQRMFMATGDSKYIDVMERGMYNNALSGISVSADHFFYVNRLSSAGDGRDLRWQRASLECCPPEHGPLPGADAGLHLRAGPEGFRLRQPLRLQRRVVQGRRQGDRAVGAERDAVWRQDDDRRDRAGGSDGRDQAAHPRLGPGRSLSRRPLLLRVASRAAGPDLRQQDEHHRDAGSHGLRDDLARVEDGGSRSTSSSRWRSARCRRIRRSRPTAAAWPSSAARSSTARSGRIARAGASSTCCSTAAAQLATSTDPSLFGGVPIIRTEARLMTQPELPRSR